MGPMGGAMPPLPGAETPAPPVDIGRLLGAAAPAGPADAQAAARAVMNQIRDLQAGVETLARQFPEIADLANQAREALTRAMTKIVAKLGATESQPAPPVVG